MEKELHRYIQKFSKQIFNSRVIVLSRQADNNDGKEEDTSLKNGQQFSSCLLCFDSIRSTTTTESFINYKEMIFKCCCRLLNDQIKGDSFCWNYSDESRSPFCTPCFESSEKMWMLEDNLINLKEELQGAIDSFYREILKIRLSPLYKKAGISEEEGYQHQVSETREIPVVSNDRQFNNKRSSLKCENKKSQFVPKNKPQIIIETFKIESIDGNIDDSLESNFELIDYDNFSSDDQSLGDYSAPVVKNTNGESVCQKGFDSKQIYITGLRELRVSLERLQFDSKGEAIVPNNYRNSRIRRRKAAIQAAGTLSRTKQKNHNAFLRDTGDDLWEFDAEDCESDSDKSEVEVKNKIKRKGTGNRKSHSHKKEKIRELLKCSECPSEFAYPLQLETHSKESGHVNERSFKCDREKCPKSFYKQSSLDRHLLHHDFHRKEGQNSKSFKCSECLSKYKYARELKAHSEESGHVNEPTFHCKMCPKKFYWRTAVSKHVYECHSKIKRTCGVCGMVTEGYAKYSTHMKTHHQVKAKDHKCDECGKSYSKRAALLVHMTFHTGEKNFKCDLCPASFRFSEGLRDHKLRHYEPNNFLQCQICHRFYKDDIVLKRHMNAHDREVNLPHCCDSCDNRFATPSKLLAHKISDHGYKSPFECKNCGDVFSRLIDLRTHLMNIHNEKMISCKETGPPFICDLCGKTLNNLKSFYKHKSNRRCLIVKQKKERKKIKYKPRAKKRILTGIFPCEVCGKIFKRKQNLTEHIKVVHTKEMSFTCHICGKSLVSRKSLNRHLFIHSGKTIDCPVCGRGFTANSNLQLHIRRIHDKNKKPRMAYTKTLGAEPKHPTKLNQSNDEPESETNYRTTQSQFVLSGHHPNISELEEQPPKDAVLTSQDIPNITSSDLQIPLQASISDEPPNFFEELYGK